MLDPSCKVIRGYFPEEPVAPDMKCACLLWSGNIGTLVQIILSPFSKPVMQLKDGGQFLYTKSYRLDGGGEGQLNTPKVNVCKKLLRGDKFLFHLISFLNAYIGITM